MEMYCTSNATFRSQETELRASYPSPNTCVVCDHSIALSHAFVELMFEQMRQGLRMSYMNAAEDMHVKPRFLDPLMWYWSV